MKKNNFFKKFFWETLFFLSIFSSLAFAQNLDTWKAKFDHRGAKYTCIVSNVAHPAIEASKVGFELRDELWKRSKGQIYLDYKPLSMLGGEVEVLNMLHMGAIQGMGVSSVAATNLGPRFGLVNLPYLINSFDKLEKFVSNKNLFNHFMMAMDHNGIVGLDITTYGTYGWATTSPVKNLDDAKKIKFRIAESSVSQILYDAWGLNPVVMPWPDVPVSLKQGVITGLDHVPTTCYVSKKFENAKYYTQTNHALGLFIWIFNKKWLNSLPDDLKKIFIETVHELCSEARAKARQQEKDSISGAQKNYEVIFFNLPEKDIETLKKQGDIAHKKYEDEINQIYPNDKYKRKNYLKEVQEFLKY